MSPPPPLRSAPAEDGSGRSLGKIRRARCRKSCRMTAESTRSDSAYSKSFRPLRSRYVHVPAVLNIGLFRRIFPGSAKLRSDARPVSEGLSGPKDFVPETKMKISGCRVRSFRGDMLGGTGLCAASVLRLRLSARRGRESPIREDDSGLRFAAVEFEECSTH